MTFTRDEANALILVDAEVFVAPVGSTAPTNTTTALDAAFKSCGWLSEDGVTETPVGSTSELKGVTGATLAYVKDGDGYEFDFICLESNVQTMSLLHQRQTIATATGVTTSTVKASVVPPQYAFVIESHYNNNSIRRRVIPLAAATVSGVVEQHKDYRKFPVKVSAIQASDTSLYKDITDNASEAVS